MASEIKLPELGENVEEGVVVDVRVKAGDYVNEGDILMEVEAGKSTVEVPATMAGTITEMEVKKGQDVQTGIVLCKIEPGEAKAEAKPAKGQKEKPPEEEEKEEAEKQPAQAAAKKETQPETDGRKEKQTKETAAPKEAPQPLEAGQSTRIAAAPAPRGLPVHPSDKPGELVPASPATRRLARELGVDLSQVHGTAPHGRVTQDDVKTYVHELATTAETGAGPAGVRIPPLPDFSKWGDIEHQPLDTIRKETARAMSLAWALIPHVTQHDLADITELDNFRRSQKSDEVKLTITAFAIKAAAIALEQFPRFNASLDITRNQLIVKKYYNIGIAVDTEHGLLVPVLRDADKKSVQQLARELVDAADRMRQKKISSDDLSAGTFTITNQGGIGGIAFTPIIRHPEVAILGMSRARRELVLRDGDIESRLMLPLSLSYDHRVIDGADAARFTRRIAEMLENPLVMLLHA